jgi:hypothetical protein
MGVIRPIVDAVERKLRKRPIEDAPKTEDDVDGDPARVDAREPAESEGFVGRVAADDDFTGETGAERRQQAGSPE